MSPRRQSDFLLKALKARADGSYTTAIEKKIQGKLATTDKPKIIIDQVIGSRAFWTDVLEEVRQGHSFQSLVKDAPRLVNGVKIPGRLT